ncbi:MAG: FG-GAP repeat protein [Bryobacteraceae bacterium]
MPGIATDNILNLTTGDFNGDGKPDLAAGISASNSINILMNTTP